MIKIKILFNNLWVFLIIKHILMMYYNLLIGVLKKKKKDLQFIKKKLIWKKDFSIHKVFQISK